MEKRILGNSGLKVSVLSLGTWVFGHTQNWGEVDDMESIDVIRKAIDHGLNHIATAQYGNAEEVLGKGLNGIHHKVYLATSTGWNASSLKEMEEKLDGALKSLQTDYIDFYYMHYPNESFPKVIEYMDALRKKGKIKHLGLSNFSRDQVKEAIKIAPIAFIHSPYNLLWREIEPELLPFCREHNIGITCYAPLAQGLLTGKYKSYEDLPRDRSRAVRRNALFQEDIFPKCLEVVQLLEEISQKYGKKPSQVSLRWLIQQPGVTSVIVGARNVRQLEENFGALDWHMADKDVKKLTDKGKEISQYLDYSLNMWGHTYYR